MSSLKFSLKLPFVCSLAKRGFTIQTNLVAQHSAIFSRHQFGFQAIKSFLYKVIKFIF